jgi:hypothetical protein
MLVVMSASSSYTDRRPIAEPNLAWHSSRALTKAAGWSNARSREARFLRAYTKLLTDYLGGMPSPIQKELIRRASRTALRLELLDVRMLAGETSDQASREYVALNSVLIRTLRALGVAHKPPDPADRGLANYLAVKVLSDGRDAA